MPNQTATLIAHTPTGDMVYKTTNYEHVLRFKRTCTEINCDYSVRFSQNIQQNASAHRRKANQPWYKKLFS
jgi:hypothetical protein